jgi:tetratricopeptide (TPR) repeat protein
VLAGMGRVALATLLLAGAGGLHQAAGGVVTEGERRPAYQRQLPAGAAATAAGLQERLGERLRQGDVAAALEAARRLYALRREHQGEDHWQTGDSLWQVKRLERLAAAGRLADDRRLQDLHRQAKAAQQAGELALAERLLRQALELQRALYGPDDPGLGELHLTLASLLRQAGRLAEAGDAAREAVRQNRRLLGDYHPHTATALAALAVVLVGQNQFEPALPLLDRAVAAYGDALGESQPQTAAAWNTLGSVLLRLDRAADAETCLRKALAARQAVFGPTHSQSLTSRNNLAVCLLAQGRLAEAQRLVEEILPLLPQEPMVLGADAEAVGPERGRPSAVQEPRLWYANLGAVQRRQGRFAEAAASYAKALEQAHRQAGAYHSETVRLQGEAALCYLAAGNWAEADRQLQRLHDSVVPLLGKRHPGFLWAAWLRGRWHEAQDQPAQAVEAYREAVRAYEAVRLQFPRDPEDWPEQVLGGSSPWFPLAWCLARLGQDEPAWQALEQGLGLGLLDAGSARALRRLPAEQQHRETALLGQLQQYQRLAEQLASLPAPEETRRQSLERVRAQRRQTEAELDRHLEQVLGQRLVALEQLQARLPPDAAVVAWLEVPAAGARQGPGEEECWGVVLRQRGRPRWVRLPAGDASPLRSVSGLAEVLRDPAGRHWREAAREFYQRYVAPLEALLGPGEGLPAARRWLVLPTRTGHWPAVEAALAAADRELPWIAYGLSASSLVANGPPERGAPRVSPGGLLVVSDPERPPAQNPTAWPSAGMYPGTSMPGATSLTAAALARACPEAVRVCGPQASKERLGQLSWERYPLIHLELAGRVDGGRLVDSALLVSGRPPSDPVEAVLAGQPLDPGRWLLEELLRQWRVPGAVVVWQVHWHTAAGDSQTPPGLLLALGAVSQACGASGVLLPRWSGDAVAGALLLARFWQLCLGRDAPAGPVPPAAALPQAQHWLRSLSGAEAQAAAARWLGAEVAAKLPVIGAATDRPYAHPFFWAGWIWVGPVAEP